MHRSHTCGELTASHIDETITLSGWVRNRRDHGGIIFIDLADRYGRTQVVFDPEYDKAAWEIADTCRSEYVIKVTWMVRSRPEGQANPDLITGEIEVIINEIDILSQSKTPPFEISDHTDAGEEVRYKHRYLDLRREVQREKIEFRAKVNAFTREWFASESFLEVQTPIFTVSSPEWARDYVIPARLHPGKFYALPQAPQQYKQLLMVSWVDKYFQIAPCFRDEDPRADRHSCEFYQVDAEMSFVEQEDVLQIAEKYATDLVQNVSPEKSLMTDSFTRLTYEQAMSRYGSDKPDIRFGCEIVDLSEAFVDSEFSVFKWALDHGGTVRAIKLEGQTMSRKEIDEVTKVAQEAGAKWLAYIVYEDEGPRSPILKFLSDDEMKAIEETLSPKSWDMVFFWADEKNTVLEVLGKVRLALRDKYALADENVLAFAWITDFPMFEINEMTGKVDFGHNPFSIPNATKEEFAEKDPLEIFSYQYDLALNGYEILSWSIRNHDLELLTAAFKVVGRDEAEIEEKFGGMYEAFQYGVPPHGGFAFWIDRFMMVLRNEDNIRDMYAFPKSGKAQDTMMNAPSELPSEDLEVLSIQTIQQEE